MTEIRKVITLWNGNDRHHWGDTLVVTMAALRGTMFDVTVTRMATSVGVLSPRPCFYDTYGAPVHDYKGLAHKADYIVISTTTKWTTECIPYDLQQKLKGRPTSPPQEVTPPVSLRRPRPAPTPALLRRFLRDLRASYNAELEKLKKDHQTALDASKVETTYEEIEALCVSLNAELENVQPEVRRGSFQAHARRGRLQSPPALGSSPLRPRGVPLSTHGQWGDGISSPPSPPVLTDSASSPPILKTLQPHSSNPALPSMQSYERYPLRGSGRNPNPSPTLTPLGHVQQKQRGPPRRRLDAQEEALNIDRELEEEQGARRRTPTAVKPSHFHSFCLSLKP